MLNGLKTLGNAAGYSVSALSLAYSTVVLSQLLQKGCSKTIDSASKKWPESLTLNEKGFVRKHFTTIKGKYNEYIPTFSSKDSLKKLGLKAGAFALLAFAAFEGTSRLTGSPINGFNLIGRAFGIQLSTNGVIKAFKETPVNLKGFFKHSA